MKKKLADEIGKAFIRLHRSQNGRREEKDMTRNIRYASENGYSGEIYGSQSLSIRDQNGKEVFHTGRRSIETYEELVRFVNTFPEFLETLMEATEEGEGE